MTEKTGEPLELPLLNSVGCAIIDYLKNGRPESKYTNVFLAHHFPYGPIGSTSSLTGALRKYLIKAEIKINALDQYGDPWKGDYSLDLRSTNTEVNNALGGASGPAYLIDKTLYVDAQAIAAVTSKTSVSFIVTEIELNKKVTITVSLKKPAIFGFLGYGE